MTQLQFSVIGQIQTPFADRFAVPRQPGLVPSAWGIIKLGADPRLRLALNRLEEFSHLWLIFVFHEHGSHDWKPSIRPPRLGGKEKVGVLASRSPHRPNPIGISAVKLELIDLEAAGGPEIHVSGVDLVDGTPILDIKPYLPYTDSIPLAQSGWASEEIQIFPVKFAQEALYQLRSLSSEDYEANKNLITEVLRLDPRPAFQKEKDPIETSTSRYVFDVNGLDIHYQMAENGFLVYEIKTAK